MKIIILDASFLKLKNLSYNRKNIMHMQLICFLQLLIINTFCFGMDNQCINKSNMNDTCQWLSLCKLLETEKVITSASSETALYMIAAKTLPMSVPMECHTKIVEYIYLLHMYNKVRNHHWLESIDLQEGINGITYTYSEPWIFSVFNDIKGAFRACGKININEYKQCIIDNRGNQLYQTKPDYFRKISLHSTDVAGNYNPLLPHKKNRLEYVYDTMCIHWYSGQYYARTVSNHTSWVLKEKDIVDMQYDENHNICITRKNGSQYSCSNICDCYEGNNLKNIVTNNNYFSLKSNNGAHFIWDNNNQKNMGNVQYQFGFLQDLGVLFCSPNGLVLHCPTMNLLYAFKSIKA